jgi:hypothetical protein
MFFAYGQGQKNCKVFFAQDMIRKLAQQDRKNWNGGDEIPEGLARAGSSEQLVAAKGGSDTEKLSPYSAHTEI